MTGGDEGLLFCGVDIGSRTIAAVLYDGAEVVDSAVEDTGARPRENALGVFGGVLKSAGAKREDVGFVVSTGYGRNYFNEAGRAASEIICHARGVSYLFPKVRTVIDIGGQDSKLISVGPEGRVLNFVMNDRCAAGTGKFLEMVARTIGEPVEKLGELSQGASEALEISSMCAVFAESEIIGLLQSGAPLDGVLKGVFRSVARRTLTMTGKVGLLDDVIFTGGVAKNPGVLRALGEETGVSLGVPHDPQITGALGAALMACEATSS